VANVTFEDRSKEFMQRLVQRANAACAAAAEELSDAYKVALSENEAPPHSSPGDIPHRYNGPARGGYDRTRRLTKFFKTPISKNNPYQVGFAGDQRTNLYTFIESSKGKSGAVVGFSGKGSHVADRRFNYLIAYDIGADSCPNPLAVSITPDQRRPWVRPVFDKVRNSLAATAATFLLSGGESSGDVPF
jgi:hypothetical protein